MTIKKGQEWGSLGPVPDGLEVAATDAELFALVNRTDRPRVIGLLGGDLARTVGASGDPARLRPGSTVALLPVDLATADHAGGTHHFLAHAVARRSWWRGGVLGVFNAQFRGRWDVAPRSHPNDGWLDVVEVQPAMTLQQRWAARSRLPIGAHVPHPAITTRRMHGGQWTFARPQRLWLDGVDVGRTDRLAITLEPDAVLIVV